MEELIKYLKRHPKEVALLISSVLVGAITYGSTQATASITFASHESRLRTLEIDDKLYGQELARIGQKIDDLWKDNGHHE